MLRTRLALLAIALVAGLLNPAAADEATAAEETSSDNLEYVANLPFDEPYDDASRKATDVDFATYVSTPDGTLLPAHAVTPDAAMPPLEEREFAFVGTYKNGLQVIDITDPENAQVVAVYDCAIAQSDVFVFEREDLERTFLAYTSDVIASQTDFSSGCHRDNGVRSGQYGTFIVDVTNPYAPESVSFVPYPRGTHQVTMHPSGEWIYSSPAALTHAPGQIDITNVTDPWHPVTVDPLELVTGLDSHDMSFNADGTRVYSAALTHTLVIDTTDPGEPEIIGRIFDPAVNIHHEAQTVTLDDPLAGERTFLLLGDEITGAAGNEVCPGGGIHVYDITGDLERSPVKVGAWFMPEAGPVPGAGQGAGGTTRCTAHVMQVHEDEGLLIVAWYAAGMRVLDLAGLVGVSAGVQAGQSLGTGMKEIAWGHFDDSDVWAAKTNRIAEDGSFYAYAIDTNRMLDIWAFTPDAESTAERGSWLTPAQALDRATSAGATTQTGPYCLLR
jgi:hypothetical protein